VKLTTHLHLESRSRMRGAIPLLPQNAFMAWCLAKKKAQGSGLRHEASNSRLSLTDQ